MKSRSCRLIGDQWRVDHVPGQPQHFVSCLATTCIYYLTWEKRCQEKANFKVCHWWSSESHRTLTKLSKFKDRLEILRDRLNFLYRAVISRFFCVASGSPFPKVFPANVTRPLYFETPMAAISAAWAIPYLFCLAMPLTTTQCIVDSFTCVMQL
jgi:hypothetical protein